MPGIIIKDIPLVDGENGHGALKKRLDVRDILYKREFKKLATAAAPFDWSMGYDIEKDTGITAITKNQGQSFSCGGQSGAYYNAMLRLDEYPYVEQSAKYIYSHIFYPQGGTTLRDLLNFIVKQGSCAETILSSYQGTTPPSEAFMRDRSQITASADADAAKNTELSYAFLNPKNIDLLAQAVRDNKGIIIQIDGQNNGTWRTSFPNPPQADEWSHFLYAGKAKMINGVKYIGVHNSWGASTGDEGWQWISEAYFKSGYVVDAGVVYPKQNVIPTPTPAPVDNTELQLTLIQRALNLIQQIIDVMRGAPSKLPVVK